MQIFNIREKKEEERRMRLQLIDILKELRQDRLGVPRRAETAPENPRSQAQGRPKGL